MHLMQRIFFVLLDKTNDSYSCIYMASFSVSTIILNCKLLKLHNLNTISVALVDLLMHGY